MALRVIPAHERAVVLRCGRVARLKGPGPVVVLPGVERVVRVSLRDFRLEPLVTRAATRDDVTVWVSATAHFRVVDPIRSTVAVPDVYASTADAIEATVRAEIDCSDIELATIDLQLNAELLHWAERLPPQHKEG